MISANLIPAWDYRYTRDMTFDSLESLKAWAGKVFGEHVIYVFNEHDAEREAYIASTTDQDVVPVVILVSNAFGRLWLSQCVERVFYRVYWFGCVDDAGKYTGWVAPVKIADCDVFRDKEGNIRWLGCLCFETRELAEVEVLQYAEPR